jgi:uncharacterized membrane protein (DUF485 family)
MESHDKPVADLARPESMTDKDWQDIAASSQFKALIHAKVKFILPAVIFFIVYYFLLPILVGYAPRLMERKVLGPVNIAYLFALSQFFVAWIIAALYVRAAGRFDRMASRIIENVQNGKDPS